MGRPTAPGLVAGCPADQGRQGIQRQTQRIPRVPRHVDHPENTANPGNTWDAWNRSSRSGRTDSTAQDWAARGWVDYSDPRHHSSAAGSSARPPRREGRFTQSRNRRGHRSAEATEARIQRGQERRAATAKAEAARGAHSAAPVTPPYPATRDASTTTEAPATAEAATEPASEPTPAADSPAPAIWLEPAGTPAGDPADEEESVEVEEESPQTSETNANPRVVLAERFVRVTPTPGPAALEASEVTQVRLVPQAERSRIGEVLERIREAREEVEEDRRVLAAAQAKEILEEPQPELPQEILEEAADYDVDSISTEESYELLTLPPEAREEAEAVASLDRTLKGKPSAPASSSKSTTALAAPPLYAAGVSARVSQSDTGIEADLSKALDLAEQIQGALSQRPTVLDEVEPVVVDERSEELRQQDGAAASCSHAAADGESSESGASVDYRATKASGDKRKAASRKRAAGNSPDHGHGTIAAILAADRRRKRKSQPAECGDIRRC